MRTTVANRFAIALLFSSCWLLVPWEQVYVGSSFGDRTVYTQYFLYGRSILDYQELSGILDYLTNEVLWHWGVRALVEQLSIPLEVVFTAIAALCLCTFSLLLLSRQRPMALLLLVNPLVVDLAFSQLRSALAISLLGIAWLNREKRWPLLLIIAACFIHTASILLLVIYYLATAGLLKGVERDKKRVVASLIATGFVIAVLITPARGAILALIGDRRAEYPDMASSLLFSMPWVALLILMLFQEARYYDDTFNRIAIVILSLVTFNIIFHGYSTRFIAAFFPVLVASILGMRPDIRVLGLLTFVFFVAFQWIYWTGYGL